MYLQAAVEAWGGAPLDSAVQTYAFAPLGMDHSFFGRPKAGVTRAAGHVTVGAAVLPGLVVFLPVAALLAALLLLSHRAVMGVWRVRSAIWLLALTGAWAVVAVFLRSRASQPGVVWFFVAVPAVLTALAGAAGLLAGRLARREAPTGWPRWGRAMLGWGGTGLTTVLATFAATPLILPVPRAGTPGGNAAASLSATAVDVAQFGIELGSPSHLGLALSTELRRPQVTVSDSVSWGLGVGIAQGATGPVLYHWGSNPSARSLLLVHPGERWVVAVVANRDASRAGLARIVKAALGEEGSWMTN
jgi:CubicO group peptidase (beta-lactamase class C family)